MMADAEKEINDATALERKQSSEQSSEQQENQEAIDTSMSIEGVIEGAEVEPSGKVAEGEKKGKDQHAGGGTSAQKAARQKAKRKVKLPSVSMMRVQVKRELKLEIKDMKKRINDVMKKSGSLEADKLNELIANLRRLKDMLSSLARATSKAIKDLWAKYVHAK